MLWALGIVLTRSTNMDVTVVWGLLPWGKEVVSVDTTPEHTAYAIGVASKKEFGFQKLLGIETEVFQVEGEPEKATNGYVREYAYLEYRMTPDCPLLVGIHFQPRLVKSTYCFSRWLERVELNHCLGLSDCKTASELGRLPGSAWPGWKNQPKSLSPSVYEILYDLQIEREIDPRKKEHMRRLKRFR